MKKNLFQKIALLNYKSFQNELEYPLSKEHKKIIKPFLELNQKASKDFRKKHKILGKVFKGGKDKHHLSIGISALLKSDKDLKKHYKGVQNRRQEELDSWLDSINTPEPEESEKPIANWYSHKKEEKKVKFYDNKVDSPDVMLTPMDSFVPMPYPKIASNSKKNRLLKTIEQNPAYERMKQRKEQENNAAVKANKIFINSQYVNKGPAFVGDYETNVLG